MKNRLITFGRQTSFIWPILAAIIIFSSPACAPAAPRTAPPPPMPPAPTAAPKPSIPQKHVMGDGIICVTWGAELWCNDRTPTAKTP